MAGRQSAATGQAPQRDISVAEFFLKNRHLLGFDTPARALLTAVKEAVDNSLDACEEALILPEIRVEIDLVETERYRIAVLDNGPGIARDQVARIFGKLLYGSKFHRLAQSRGQQGMGISAAGMYAQLTTGMPTRVLTRVVNEDATEMLVTVDTRRNRPDIRRRRRVSWPHAHGTLVELELEGQYQHGQHSVLLYMKLVSIVNPHVSLCLREPDGTVLSWPRQLRRKPPVPKSIKPHPAGVELGVLMSMLKTSKQRRLGAFLREELSQVGSRRAQEIIARAGQRLSAHSSTHRIDRRKAAALLRAIAQTDVPAPPNDCVVPIGAKALLRGLGREVPGRFMVAISRRPAVYRGNPCVVEVALSYGRQDGAHVEVDEHGHLRGAGETTTTKVGHEPVRMLRFANRVPLLYQQSHCAMTQAVSAVHWSRYGLQQPSGALPLGAMTLLMHIASVWVPFTSESKEAIADYPEIARELALALQYCGRKLAAYVNKQRNLEEQLGRQHAIERYLPHVGDALRDLLDLDDTQRQALVASVDGLLQDERGVRE